MNYSGDFAEAELRAEALESGGAVEAFRSAVDIGDDEKFARSFVGKGVFDNAGQESGADALASVSLDGVDLLETSQPGGPVEEQAHAAYELVVEEGAPPMSESAMLAIAVEGHLERFEVPVAFFGDSFEAVFDLLFEDGLPFGIFGELPDLEIRMGPRSFGRVLQLEDNTIIQGEAVGSEFGNVAALPRVPADGEVLGLRSEFPAMNFHPIRVATSGRR